MAGTEAAAVLCRCRQELLAINTQAKQCVVLGSVDRHAVCYPDVPSLLRWEKRPGTVVECQDQSHDRARTL